MGETAPKFTMRSMGRDMPLYHLFYSQKMASSAERRIEYLTEDGGTVQITEAVKVDDANVGVEGLSAILEDMRSRIPDVEYAGRGIWCSSRDIERSFLRH